MSDEPAPFPPDELERRGLYDPEAADAPERLELIRYAMALGATIEEVAASSNLGELALDLNLRPRGPLTIGQVLDQLSIERSTATRLLTALGMTTDPSEPVTTEEAEAIRLFVASTALVGEEAAVQLARVTGSAMAKVAETLVGSFRLQFEIPRLESGVRYIDLIKEYSDITQSLLPAFVSSLDALLRQQIVAVAKRMWSTDEEHSTVTLWRTVGFVDLVGYTEVTGSLSARDLAGVLIDFDERTAQAVRQGNGQVIKMIGDEAMFATEDPADACRISLDLVAASDNPQAPPVRVGLATGEMVSVFGDLYGPDVNLAARLVAAAEPETVVVSRRTADGAPSFVFEALPSRPLKGFPAAITPYRLVSSAPGRGA
jgi:adenylate cyclase